MKIRDWNFLWDLSNWCYEISKESKIINISFIDISDETNKKNRKRAYY